MENAAIKKVSLYIIISSLIFLFSGCSLTGQNNTITIPINIPRALISDLGKISLTVSGPGMNTIEVTYTSTTDNIEIKVPSGGDREFTLKVYISSENGFPAYQGSTIVDLVPGSSLELSISLDFAGGTIYVANSGSDSVSVIDGARNTVITTIPVGVEPGGVGVNTVTRKVYVSNALDGMLSVIDSTSNIVVNTINGLTSNSDPHFVAVNSTTNRIYVSEFYADSVTVVNGTTDSIIINVDTWQGGVGSNYTFGLGVNPYTNKIYVAKSDFPAIIDGLTNLAVFLTTGAWGDSRGVGIYPGLNKIYVADFSDDNVHVVDGSTDTEIGTIPVGANAEPYGVGVDVNRNMIYVANFADGTVSIIDGLTDTVIDTITVGTDPMGVAVNSSTARVYVANSGSNNVSVIDGFTNTVIATIPVESIPHLIEVMPYTE